MNQWELDLGKTIKAQRTSIVEPCIGVVVSAEPFAATIYDGRIRLTKKNTYICQAAIQKAYEFKEATGTLNGQGFTARGVVTLKDVLLKGMQVLVIPINHGQRFVVVDVLAGGWL